MNSLNEQLNQLGCLVHQTKNATDTICLKYGYDFDVNALSMNLDRIQSELEYIASFVNPDVYPIDPPAYEFGFEMEDVGDRSGITLRVLRDYTCYKFNRLKFSHLRDICEDFFPVFFHHLSHKRKKDLIVYMMEQLNTL
jgi:hypothetical protein